MCDVPKATDGREVIRMLTGITFLDAQSLELCWGACDVDFF